jgi:hypothetical protein
MRRRDFILASTTLAASLPLRNWAAASTRAADLPAKSLDGDDLVLGGSDVQSFAASMRGEVLRPNHSSYDARRRIWNAMFDRRPALIACCSGAADVRRAVDFAREHRLLTAVRAGGHSLSGKSTCEGGLVVDLQSMQGVRVDPKARRAYLEAGSLLGQLDHECAAFGLATTAGAISHTGAAGLTLGGGFGRLGRRFGLACDNAASFDVVTADGRLVRANDRENPDLYWGLRGGGGNFGVVTAIEYRVHPMDPVILGGNVLWPLSQARDVMRFYRDITPTAPEDVHLEFGLMPTPDGRVCYIEACWSGDRAKGEAWLAPLRKFARPLHDDIAPMPYVRIQASYDEQMANGQYNYAKSGFLASLDDAGIDAILDVYRRVPVEFLLFFDPCDGAYQRVASDATAFPHRRVLYWMGMVGVWPRSEGVDEKIAQLRSGWRDLQPLARGFYTNMAYSDTTLAGYRENYGANLERLVALKAKYDPMNLFRLNANVPPKI